MNGIVRLLENMPDLSSIDWSRLKIPQGSATEVSAGIAAFRSVPTLDAFDELWDLLSGVGDIEITDAFWTALPYLVDPILKLPQAEREQAIGQIGWGIALASTKREDLAHECDRIAIAAFECLRSPADSSNKRYLLAAIAACCNLTDVALTIIHNE